jgi:hypothetical protein
MPNRPSPAASVDHRVSTSGSVRMRGGARLRPVVAGLAFAAAALLAPNVASAQVFQQIPLPQLQQPPQLQPLPQLQQQSRLVTFQGGGLQFLDATAPDRFNLGLNVVIASFTNAQSQQWLIVQQGGGAYTIQQRSSGQFLDAHETGADNLDYMVVTRSRQAFGNGDNGQFWRIVEYGGGFVTIQQVSSGRLLEPYIDAAHGFQVVTRPQGSQLQQWRMIDAQN